MAKKKYNLITVASWEDRFLEGTRRLCKEYEICSINQFYIDKYSEWSAEQRDNLRQFAMTNAIPISPRELKYAAPAQVWLESIVPTIESIATNADVLVDVSTMPREIIWQVFWMLGRMKRPINYVYHRPSGYGDWLSRDPGKPRLAFKMSGLSKLDFRTALVVLAGYDVDRVKHLIATFEPSVTLLGLQKNSIDPQNQSRMQKQRAAFEKDSGVLVFEVDAYSSDHGFDAVRNAIAPFATDHNILLTSMGPKLSAIALFRMHWEDESLGLVYLPANELNRDYSHGIRETVYGSIPNENRAV